jgi:hypothetical protein
MPETTGDDVLDAILDRRRKEYILELEHDRDSAERRAAEAKMKYSQAAATIRDLIHDNNNLRAYCESLETEVVRLSQGFVGKLKRQVGWGHR